MTRKIAAFAVLALVLVACGGDDEGADEGTTATQQTGDTAAATTTTVAATTTTETLTGPQAFIAASQAYVGEYRGEWSNTTFGSSGGLYFKVVEANTEAGFVLIQVDIDGNAFGASDPDQFVVEISTAGQDLYVGFSTFLGGDATFVTGADGSFTFSAEPGTLGMTLDVEGSITEDGFAGTYTIPGLAEGTWNAAPVG